MFPATAIRTTDPGAGAPVSDSFEPFTDWDTAATDTRRVAWGPKPVRLRPELTATRWRGRRVKSDLYRDDPPA